MQVSQRVCQVRSVARLLPRNFHGGGSGRDESTLSKLLIESLNESSCEMSSLPIRAHWAPCPVKVKIRLGTPAGLLMRDGSKGASSDAIQNARCESGWRLVLRE